MANTQIARFVHQHLEPCLHCRRRDRVASSMNARIRVSGRPFLQPCSPLLGRANCGVLGSSLLSVTRFALQPTKVEAREYLLHALQPTRWGKVSARLVERIILYNSRMLSVRAPECLLGKEREVPLSESHPTPEDMPTWRLGPGMNQERSGTRCEPQSANCGTSCRNLV